MSAIDPEALKRAKEMVNRNLGGIADLEEELRNTVANTYYRICQLDLEQEAGLPLRIGLEGDLEKGWKKFCEEASLLTAGAKHLPELLEIIRDCQKKGNRIEYEKGKQGVLDMFKYRIPDLAKKSALRVSMERPFYAAKVDEIPNLWSLF
jgi:hypothetical protein